MVLEEEIAEKIEVIDQIVETEEVAEIVQIVLNVRIAVINLTIVNQAEDSPDLKTRNFQVQNLNQKVQKERDLVKNLIISIKII
jgi:hypothetical protein